MERRSDGAQEQPKRLVHRRGPGLLLQQIPAPAGDTGGDVTSPQFPPVGAALSAANSQAGDALTTRHDVVPTSPPGSFSPAAISGLARGLTELSGALLTIARALQQLAPHPTSGSVAGPTVLGGPADAARGESTEAPKRGAEPRPAPKPKGQPKPGKWTPERRALLEQMRHERKPAPEILAAVNALPGEPAAMQQMHSYAYSIGLRTNGPAPRSSTSWNAARDAVMREGYECGDELETILAAVNAIQGLPPVVSAEAIKSRAQKLKIVRSEAGMRRARDRANAKMRGVGRAWSDDMVAALRQHYPNKAMRLDAIAAALTTIAGDPVTISAVQQKAWELGIRRPHGIALGTRRLAQEPAAAAAQARDTSAPPAPKAEAPAAAPPTTTEPARPTVQTIIGHNGARVTIAAAPKAADDEPPPYDATRKTSVEARVERARELLRKKTAEHIVVMQTRLPLREVMRIAGEIRMERAA